jgi:hypothetical protein
VFLEPEQAPANRWVRNLLHGFRRHSNWDKLDQFAGGIQHAQGRIARVGLLQRQLDDALEHGLQGQVAHQLHTGAVQGGQPVFELFARQYHHSEFLTADQFYPTLSELEKFFGSSAILLLLKGR